ncbi:MAG: NAD(P)-dependent oxidoreductase [Paracoccaceae bacterium]
MPRLVMERPPMPEGQALLDARPDVEVTILEGGSSLEALQAAMPGADAVVLGVTPFGRETLTRANRLAVVSRFGVGYDNVDVPALTERGIPLAVVGEANCETVADHALGMTLAMLHRIPVYDRRMREGRFTDRQFDAQGDLWRKTALVVGFGRIGRRVAKRLAAFDVTVLVSDPYIDPAEIADRGFERVEDLDAALGRADIVTLHLPALPEGRPLMGAREFGLMRPGAWFVNVSRGSLVDEPALREALTSGRLSGAALDVFAREPIDDDDPFLGLENLVLTPHIASGTRECWNRMSAAAVRNALDGIDGRLDPALVVNPETLRG